MRLGVRKKDEGRAYVQVRMEQVEVSVNDNFEFLLKLR